MLHHRAFSDGPQAVAHEINADVIVLGAGISGLACASALRDAGLRVIVLEARDRIGGRLHTVALGGRHGCPHYAVDMGGAWVHGIGSNGSPNELFKMACELSLTCRPTDYSDAAVYTADGVRLDERAVADIESLYHIFEQHLQSLLSAPDPRLALMPIQTALDAFSAARGLSPDDAARLTFAASNHMEHYWAGELRCMGIAALDEEVLPGGDVVLAEGYGSIVQRLAAGLDVRLGHEVLAVQYGSAGGPAGAADGGVAVTARLAAGGGAGAGAGVMTVRLVARAAVVTLPLGVLRSGSVCFSPPLEAADPPKAAAIRGLGVALYNKLVMLFRPEDVFWDDTAFVYRMPAPHENGRWSFFLNLYKVSGAPILIAFNLGEAAEELEAASDEATVESALAALVGVYGAARVRRPIQAAVTRWGSDPYSRMSYTYVSAGLTCVAFDDLARPVRDRLFFAGEATHRRHYGTAHGAYDSGRLAAAAILRQLSAEGHPGQASRSGLWALGQRGVAPADGHLKPVCLVPTIPGGVGRGYIIDATSPAPGALPPRPGAADEVYVAPGQTHPHGHSNAPVPPPPQQHPVAAEPAAPQPPPSGPVQASAPPMPIRPPSPPHQMPLQIPVQQQQQQQRRLQHQQRQHPRSPLERLWWGQGPPRARTPPGVPAARAVSPETSSGPPLPPGGPLGYVVLRPDLRPPESLPSSASSPPLSHPLPSRLQQQIRRTVAPAARTSPRHTSVGGAGPGAGAGGAHGLWRSNSLVEHYLATFTGTGASAAGGIVAVAASGDDGGGGGSVTVVREGSDAGVGGGGMRGSCGEGDGGGGGSTVASRALALGDAGKATSAGGRRRAGKEEEEEEEGSKRDGPAGSSGTAESPAALQVSKL